MHSELTGTDIRYIAKGYWRHKFKWGFHPRVKLSMIIALVTFVAGIAVVVGDFVDTPTTTSTATNSTIEVMASSSPSAVIFVAMALVLVALGFFLRGMYVLESEEDKFLDSVTAHWEAGDKSIPSAKTVAEFLGESK